MEKQHLIILTINRDPKIRIFNLIRHNVLPYENDTKTSFWS